jgi:endonuclease YncB( thermonuclease family)
MFSEEVLRTLNDDSVSDATYYGVYPAKIVKAYDGDTCDAIFVTPDGRVVKETLRLNGINTPELTGGTHSSKQRGIDARVRLIQLVCGVTLSTEDAKKEFPDHRLLVRLHAHGERGNFGRLLSTLYPYDTVRDSLTDPFDPDTLDTATSFNQMLIDEGHAVVYR